MHAFDTPGKTRLRVKNAAGLISVDPSETGRTTVELEALRDDDATREAIERATVEHERQRGLGRDRRRRQGLRRRPGLDLLRPHAPGRHPHPLPRRHRARLRDGVGRRRRHRPARRGGVEDGLRRRRRRARRRAPRPVGERRRPCRDGRRRGAHSDRLRRRPPRHGHRPGLGDARLGRLRDRRRAYRPVRQDRLRRPADRRDPRGADQAPVGLGRRPRRRPARHAPPHRRQLDERRRQLRARRQGHPVRRRRAGREARLQAKTVSGDIEITRAAAVSA